MRRSLFIGLLWLVCSLGFAEQPARSLDQVISDYAAATGFSGAVLVALDDKIAFQGAVGLADRAWQVPVSNDTRFVIGSLTKSMTATLVLRLVEQGQLNLADTLKHHLPDYPAGYAGEVTLQQMLVHSSGIPNFPALDGWFEGKYLAATTPQAFSLAIARLPLAIRPGTGREYSNANYFLLGRIIERVTQQSYAENLRKWLFQPLDMAASGVLQSNSEIVPQLAVNYRQNDAGVFVKGGRVNIEHFYASASNYSTVADLYLWARGLMQGRVLSQPSLNLMFDPNDPIGWNVIKSDLTTVITYNGELEGYTSMLTMLPEEGAYTVLLNNSGAGYDGLRTLTNLIIQAALHGVSR